MHYAIMRLNLLNRFQAILYSILLFVLMPTKAVAKERWQSDAYIEQSFIKIALELEYKEFNHPKLIRWVKPIKVYFESDMGDSKLQRDMLTVQMQHLAYISGLSISFTPTIKDAGILVFFTRYSELEDKIRHYVGDPEKMRKAINEAICISNFRINKRHEITRSVIIIPVDYAREKAKLVDCVVEEITQSLGLPNDSNDVFPSIFNDVSVDTFLSPLDYILLKALYSPHLKNGMSVQQTKAVFPQVLKDLHASGDIENAAQRVRVNSLRSYLGE